VLADVAPSDRCACTATGSANRPSALKRLFGRR